MKRIKRILFFAPLCTLLFAGCLVTVPVLDEEAFGGALHLSETTEETSAQNALVLAAALTPSPLFPEINIRESGTSYMSGGTFSFAGRGSGQLPFTVENTGTAPLMLGMVSITNGGNYSVTQPVSLVVMPGGTTTFTAGNFNGAGGSAVLTITNNDPDESTYTINTLQCGC